MNKKQVRDYAKIHIMSIFVLCIIAIGFGSSACESENAGQICFEIDGADCPGAINNAAVLTLGYKSYKKQYQGMLMLPGHPLNGQFYISDDPFVGGVEVEVVHHESNGFGTAGNVETDSYVDGWYNPFVNAAPGTSRLHYVRYSYKEIFQWKFGRPWTHSDGTITNQQARDWFNERHRVLMGYLYNQYPYDGYRYPENVQTYPGPQGTICFNTANSSSGQTKHSFSGEIEFPNGVRCRIDPNPTEYRESFGSDGSPHKKKLKIRKPCVGC